MLPFAPFPLRQLDQAEEFLGERLDLAQWLLFFRIR